MASLNSSLDSFSDTEKSAIMGLILLKKKPVVFKRSKFDNDDTLDTGDRHVDIRANASIPNDRVSPTEIKTSPCSLQTEMNISNTRISFHGDKERSREKDINMSHDKVYTKEPYFMHYEKKDNNKNSEYLKDGRTTRMKLQSEERDQINVDCGEAGGPNDMFYHSQTEAPACAGKIEMVNPNSRVSVHEGNSRKRKEAPNMHHYYVHTKKLQPINRNSENTHKKKDENLMYNMKEREKLAYGEKGAIHLGYKDGENSVLQKVSSADINKKPSPKTKPKRNGSYGISEGQDKKNDHGGRDKRATNYTGVTDYRRTGKWQAFIWITNGYQRSLGYYYIPEAAARASDKAHLVLRSPSRRKLNYPEADYDMRRIEEWKLLSEEEFVQMLCNQSTEHSEACIDGLNDEAARQLLEMITKEKQARS